MTSSPLISALEILKWATTFFDQFSLFDVIRFDEPEPSEPLAQLKGFDTAEAPDVRLCCAIGWQPARDVLPDFTATQPMDISGTALGSHRYGGPTLTWDPRTLHSPDPVGHIYSRKGGLIDVAHARDHADLTRFLAIQAQTLRVHDGTVSLADEAGARTITFFGKGKPITPRISALLGARASYDCAIWHEIVTWASIGFLNTNRQPYSAFSPEDNYSNLLGAYLGYRAMLMPKAFNTAMSEMLAEVLLRLNAQRRETTITAVDYVTNRWFRYDNDNNLELLRRHFDALGTVSPWLVTDLLLTGPGNAKQHEALLKVMPGPSLPVPIHIPDDDHDVGPLSELYEFKVVLDDSLAASFVGSRTQITSADFPALIAQVKQEVLASYPEGDKP